MKPLYVKKNGVVYRVSGTGIPSIYPAANVEYDNTVTSELQATDVQDAIDELSTRQGGVQSDWDEDDTTELSYIQNKPVNLVQDANYVHTDNNYDATAKGKVDSLGTASTKNVGVANGVAELDAAGKVPSSQLPSFVDDVIEVADYDHLPITGESGKIYVTLDTNKTYRWTGSGYAEISESLALGETSSTAYRGDRGKTAYNHATETKLSTATASGLYKVAATAQGHISSLTAVEKSDITALGIPGSDTIIKNTAYGTCNTAGDVKDKVATLVDATNWVLEVGTIVGVRFTYTNTYTPSSGNAVTLNVNNTGAKNIRYSDGIGTGTGDIKCPTAYGESGQTIYYMYDGTYWVWVSHSKDNDTLYNFVGREFRSCNFQDAGLATGFGGDADLMVVNGVYYYNSNGPSTSIGASANDGSVFVHVCDDGYVVQIAQNYETGNIFVRAMNDNVWSAWKKPDAGTINGLTVQTAVPANAVFTDTNTTYTFANGTNGFTVTPSGGSAQTVTVTPSISLVDTANKLNGFSSRSTTMAWGNQTGTVITCFGSPNGGGWGFRDDNPVNGQTSMTIDGTVYIKEGNVNVGDAVKSFSVSGTTVTYTTLWGNTGTFTTSDHTYNFGGTTFYSGNSGNAEHNANSIQYNGVYYYTSNGPSTAQGATVADGALYAEAYSTSWVGQIAQDYRNGNLWVRGKNNGTFQYWKGVVTDDILLSLVPTANKFLFNPIDRKIIANKSTSAWDAQVYSKNGYTTNCQVAFKPAQTNMAIMFGLDNNPAADANYNTIDYCWYTQNSGGLSIYENGTSISSISGHTTYAAGDDLRIEYANGVVKYYHNGVCCRSVARAVSGKLYVDSSFNGASGAVYDFYFGPTTIDASSVNGLTFSLVT